MVEITGRRLEQLMDQMRREDSDFDAEIRHALRSPGGPAQVALAHKDKILAHFGLGSTPKKVTPTKTVEVETKPVTSTVTKAKGKLATAFTSKKKPLIS
jgi:hypothetical protein